MWVSVLVTCKHLISVQKGFEAQYVSPPEKNCGSSTLFIFFSGCLFSVPLFYRERERDRQTNRQIDRQGKRDRQTDSQTEKERRVNSGVFTIGLQ